MSQYFPTDMLHSVFTTFQTTLSSGRFGALTSMHIPINENTEGVDGIRLDSSVIAATFTPAFGNYYQESSVFNGTRISRNDILKYSRGNVIVDEEHCGNALSLDGSDDYAYRNSTTDLNLNESDFIISCWIKTQHSGDVRYIMDKHDTDEGFIYQLNSSGNIRFWIRSVAGGNSTILTSSNTVNDNLWHHLVIIVDRSGYMYTVIDGIFDNSANISSFIGSIDNSTEFAIGNSRFSAAIITADFDQIRIFDLGKDGIYVSSGAGTNAVKMQVGDSNGSILYDGSGSVTNPDGMIPDMFYSPYESLTNLGYENEDNISTTLMIDSDFSVDTDGFNDRNITMSAPESYGGVSDCIKTYASTANDTHALETPEIEIKNDKVYEVSFDYFILSTNTNVDGVLVSNGVTGVSNQTTTDSWITYTAPVYGTGDYASIRLRLYLTDGGAISFAGAGSSSDDIVYFKNITFKEVGLIAEYKMNESGTPATLYDETDNSFDLTTVGSPSMTTNYYNSPKIYNSVNPHTGTISFWITPFWDGDDGLYHHILEIAYNTQNRIRFYKSDVGFYFLIEGSDNAVFVNKTAGSLNWSAGESHLVTGLYSKNSIDGTYYMQLYLDGSLVDSETSVYGDIQAIESEWDLGHDDGSWQAKSILSNFMMSEIPYYDTKANAITAGFPEHCSIEWLYNSGDGNKPVVDEYMRFLHTVE